MALPIEQECMSVLDFRRNSSKKHKLLLDTETSIIDTLSAHKDIKLCPFTDVELNDKLDVCQAQNTTAIDANQFASQEEQVSGGKQAAGEEQDEASTGRRSRAHSRRFRSRPYRIEGRWQIVGAEEESFLVPGVTGDWDNIDVDPVSYPSNNYGSISASGNAGMVLGNINQTFISRVPEVSAYGLFLKAGRDIVIAAVGGLIAVEVSNHNNLDQRDRHSQEQFFCDDWDSFVPEPTRPLDGPTKAVRFAAEPVVKPYNTLSRKQAVRADEVARAKTSAKCKAPDDNILKKRLAYSDKISNAVRVNASVSHHSRYSPLAAELVSGRSPIDRLYALTPLGGMAIAMAAGHARKKATVDQKCDQIWKYATKKGIIQPQYRPTSLNWRYDNAAAGYVT